MLSDNFSSGIAIYRLWHMTRIFSTIMLFSALCFGVVSAREQSIAESERMFEHTFVTTRIYSDPFNDVDIDVVFARDGRTWRVPTFWRGGSKWTVRFAPPSPGIYSYRFESTDKGDADLKSRSGEVEITAYHGDNELLKHGMLRIAQDRRTFEFDDGKPFFWLGDTWWTGLSDRLPWEGFQTLSEDRKSKGFTVVQICAGLVPSNEELAPVDPGFSNEGGQVWDSHFGAINPVFFDFADRRIFKLIDSGIVPAIAGGWRQVLPQMGEAKMRKHWRYIVARYGAYPVFWIAGGEVYDPPPGGSGGNTAKYIREMRTPGWTNVVRYIHALDPYHHPLTVHEVSDVSLQDATLTDFDLTQPSHTGWSAIGKEVSELDIRYSRTEIKKPIVVGEIGYEWIGGTHLEDFQRAAFWLAELNGAAGYTYGAAPVYEANNSQKPLHRNFQYTFLTWEEGMKLPGSYQIGLGAKLLKQYEWWGLQPHPDWITPHGTTLLEPHRGINGFDAANLDDVTTVGFAPTYEFLVAPEEVFPTGEWKEKRGTFRLPYAAGIPAKLRIIYIPYFGTVAPPPPTVLSLEEKVAYHAYYWEPSLGIKFDLGRIERPELGAVVYRDDFRTTNVSRWRIETGKVQWTPGALVMRTESQIVLAQAVELDTVVTVQANSESNAGLLLRYQDKDNYVAAVFSPNAKRLYLTMRKFGNDSVALGAVDVPAIGALFHLSAEARGAMGAATISDDVHTYSTPIVDLVDSISPSVVAQPALSLNRVGLLHLQDETPQRYSHFEIRQSPKINADGSHERRLYDARGIYRGEVAGPGWEDYAKVKNILLGSYRPPKLPSMQDWVLIMEAK